MDEFTADAFANREEPIPYVAVPQNEGEPSSPDSERRRDKMKRYLSATNMKNKAQGIVASQLDENRIKPGNSMILQQVIPADEDDDYETTPTSPAEKRSSAYVSRPAFSLPLMTNNFRRFNARIGIVFVFQNQLIRLFTWRVPTHTLSFLATYTFVCLDPYLLVVLPLAVALLSIMVPAFTSRHPPPPRHSALSSTTPYDHQAYTGPAIAPARTIKPVSETSKDFFRNMRDLQNSMADFSNGHDLMVTTVAPATNFSNETFSSQLFLYLTILTTLSFITAHLLPWRLISLLTGWSLVVSNHPTAQSWLAKMQKRAEKQAQLTLNDPTLKHQAYIQGIPLPATPARMQSALTSLSEITLSSTPETREVEIFELQHRPLQSMTSKSSAAAEWQPHVFTSSPYDPLSPSRIAGDRPHGTRFFEDVAPPEGWEWASKKWELDLEAGEWVNDRLVVGVEYDILQHDDDPNIATNRRDSINADFGGWVWDLPPVPGSGANREDDLWLAYGEYDVPSTSHMKEDGERRKKNAEKRIKDWEEGTIVDNKGRTGEWRRRRWVRLVKRKPVDTTT
ncbi:integral peroxisomal membrane peroxin-domain-containing protein [Exophiala viscosa]|uniref:Integral peroxisomal membrane peroxin-domain-containing protein n=1 Tax=Exophiala viscosa TaxID=2486360 RepID=A0AAN6DXC2_9EURO|nr:integral peroxisomal membrane peroxin-domain-containing protein [Exophiala viscosa]